VRAFPILLIVFAAALAGCGKIRMAMPPKGYDLTYLRVMTPARPYPEAAVVKLGIDNTEIDQQSGRVIEHPETIRVLTSAERSTFESALHRLQLIGVPPAEPPSPACFVPHHFFRYYSATGQQIGEVAVCFCCRGFMATPALPYGNGQGGRKDEFSLDIARTKAFVRSLGLPTDMMCD
jgi:hypothetical protein